MAAATDTIRYHVTGMDCASCAAKIEGAARKVEGVDEVKVSIASQIMTLNVDDPQTRLPAIEQAVTSLGYQDDVPRGGVAHRGPRAFRRAELVSRAALQAG